MSYIYAPHVPLQATPLVIDFHGHVRKLLKKAGLQLYLRVELYLAKTFAEEIAKEIDSEILRDLQSVDGVK